MPAPMKRFQNRANEALRPVFLGANYVHHADGSCFVKFGNTHVVCTATIETRVPPFLRGKNSGWVTAEYGMLPCSSPERIEREAAKGKQSGRTQEIQRLIGRSLRAVVDMKLLGERQIRIDCDVMMADGGTRTASITGAYVALRQAVNKLLKNGQLTQDPIIDQLAAVSCGLIEGEAKLDIDYAEDSKAEVDANFVMTKSGKMIEVQASAEGGLFNKAQFDKLYDLAEKGTAELFGLQLRADI